MSEAKWYQINPSGRKSSRVFLWATTALIFILLTLILNPIHTHPNNPVKTNCLWQMKQLSIGMVIYGADFDERLPSANWHSALQEYVKEDPRNSLFDCPVLRRQGKKWGYAMNSKLVGAPVDSIKNPDSVVLLFETDYLEPSRVGAAGERAYRVHDKAPSSCVGYLNGHVKVERPDDN